MALGAQPADILRLVVGQGMQLTIAGIVMGLIGAVALTRVMTSLLFGVGATDVLTFASVAAALAAVGLMAVFIPARRATQVDPIVALRDE
jgi:ABC-type antimicrobial peptide transport system permease subunit